MKPFPHSRFEKKVGCLAVGMVFFSWIAALVVTGCVLYAAIHFIQKYW